MQKFVKRFVVVQNTGFVPYYVYSWDGVEVHWVVLSELAKRFSRRRAQAIAYTLNARRPAAVNPVTVQPG